MTVLTARGELVDEIAGIIQDARAERFNPDASAHSAARRILDFLGDRERQQDDEIERRISECESHRVLVDAVLAEREAELQFRAWQRQVLVDGWREGPPPLDHRLNHYLVMASYDYQVECARHRRAVADSIGGA